MKRAFGRDYIADKRDRKFLVPRTYSKRTSRSWRLGPNTDQGHEPSCVGHAWFNFLTSSPIRQQPIRPSGIYELAKCYDEWEGTDYDGTSVRGAAKVLTLTGHISEYRWAFDLDTAVNHVLEHGPLVVGTNWYSNMSEPDERGLIDASGIFEGGHAYLIYAVNTKKRRAKLRNSWGIEWGIKGNAEISFDCLAKLIAEDGEACTAMESQVAA